MKKNIILCIVSLILSLIALLAFVNHPIIMARVAGFLAVFCGGGIFLHYWCEILCDILCEDRKEDKKDKGELK
jgi:hypothetical protein